VDGSGSGRQEGINLQLGNVSIQSGDVNVREGVEQAKKDGVRNLVEKFRKGVDGIKLISVLMRGLVWMNSKCVIMLSCR
jgi:hypothetical protein